MTMHNSTPQLDIRRYLRVLTIRQNCWPNRPVRRWNELIHRNRATCDQTGHPFRAGPVWSAPVLCLTKLTRFISGLPYTPVSSTYLQKCTWLDLRSILINAKSSVTSKRKVSIYKLRLRVKKTRCTQDGRNFLPCRLSDRPSVLSAILIPVSLSVEFGKCVESFDWCKNTLMWWNLLLPNQSRSLACTLYMPITLITWEVDYRPTNPLPRRERDWVVTNTDSCFGHLKTHYITQAIRCRWAHLKRSGRPRGCSVCTHFSVVQSPAGFERVECWDHSPFTGVRIYTYIGTRHPTNTQSVVLVRPLSLLRKLSVRIRTHVHLARGEENRIFCDIKDTISQSCTISSPIFQVAARHTQFHGCLWTIFKERKYSDNQRCRDV